MLLPLQLMVTSVMKGYLDHTVAIGRASIPKNLISGVSVKKVATIGLATFRFGSRGFHDSLWFSVRDISNDGRLRYLTPHTSRPGRAPDLKP